MLKRREKLIIKLLILSIFTSLVPTTITFASVNTTIEVANNGLVNSNVTDESDFTFDAKTGTITGYVGADTTIVIPSKIKGISVISIEECAFEYCYNLKNIIVEDNNINYTSVDGVLFNKSKTSIIKYPSGKENKSYMIPSSVTSIVEFAFSRCSSLTSITIPSSVTSIDNYAFGICGSLTSITIPDSVTSISNYAFLDCNNATFYVNSEKTKTLLSDCGIDESKIIVNGQASTIKVTSIALNTTNMNWTVGTTGTFTTTVLPSNATDKTVTWTSSDNSIVSVSSSGVVTATGNGTATIRATAKDGSNIYGTKNIKVSEQTTTSTTTDVKVTGITIIGSDSITSKGGTLTLAPNITQITATDKSVTWASSDISIATVSSSGVVTAVGNGTVIIKATANDGSGVVGTKVITVLGKTTSSSDLVLKSVSILGTEEVGHKLKVKVKYKGTKPSLGYQWKRASKKDGDYGNINGAYENEYKLKSSDNNKYIKVVITATINGQTYTVEDITNKIDKASSNDNSSDTSSEEPNNNSNSSNMASGNVRPLMPTNNNSSTVSGSARPLMPY